MKKAINPQFWASTWLTLQVLLGPIWYVCFSLDPLVYKALPGKRAFKGRVN